MIKPVIIISIDDKTLSTFERVTLNQTINNHHHFEVVVDQEIIEKQGAHTIEKSKVWLGKPIVITFDEVEFLGVITNVQLSHGDGFNGQIIVSGYSKTILLEGGKHMQSWLKKGLGKIVTEVVGAAGIGLEVAPTYTTPFEYQAQYQETHFQFLQRLAKQHNEWFFYDGLKLVFGKPVLRNPIELEYGVDIDNINISISALPSKHNVFSYNSLDDKKAEGATKNSISGLNELGDFAFGVSKDLYPIVPNSFSSARVNDKGEIDEAIKNKQSSRVSESNLLSASSTKQGLTVGTVIKVSAGMMKNGSIQTKNYGEFIITSISHDAEGTGSYSNHFEAISSGVEFLAEPNVELPVAEAQIATVLSNEDPEKKGRIEVKFQWQTGEMKTSWVRMMTPDAGSSDKVGVNRGLVFIPEKDDQVMVGFRYNDPNRPFVMGSMFSGSTGAGGDDANKIKSITTRSGNTVVFDDDTGSITLSDAKQNTVTLDGEGNISVNASASIKLTTGESSLSMESDGTIDLVGVNVSVTGSKTVTNHSPKEVTINGDESVMISSPKMVNINSTKEVVVNGTTKATISSSATTEIQGTIIKLN